MYRHTGKKFFCFVLKLSLVLLPPFPEIAPVPVETELYESWADKTWGYVLQTTIIKHCSPKGTVLKGEVW